MVELLAVIVILAIILVIAIPEILNTIEKSKVNAMESSAKLLASTIETKYQAASAVGDEFNTSGSCMDMGNLDSDEYASCAYTIDANGKAKVTLIGKTGGKFANYKITDATKFAASAVYDLVCTTGYTRTGTTSTDSKCIVNSYTVSFDVNGGTGSYEDMTVTYDTKYGTLPEPSRTGYTFYGWYTATTGGTLIESTSTVNITEDTTLYAMWTAITYAVTVDAKAGAVIPATEGWTISSDSTSATKDLTYDSVYGTLPEPTKTGYMFDGWYLEELYTNKVESTTTLLSTSNHVLYAKWNINSYTLTVDLNSGTCTGCAVTGSQNYGTVVALGTPTRTGYDFTGWSITPGTATLSGTSLTIGASDVTVQATWTIKSYTLTVDLNNGTCTGCATTGSQNYGAVVALGTPTRTNYKFTGWTITSGTATLSGSNLTIGLTDVTVQAGWELDAYVITLDANGGSVSSSSVSITPGSAYGTLPTPTYSGKYFAGWYTLSSGGIKVESTDVPTGATTLYAHWADTQFAADSWATISANVKAGTTSGYTVGETKCIALKNLTTSNSNGCSNGEFKVRIANNSNYNCSYASKTACGFVLEFVDIISEQHMNTDKINTGGWPASEMNTYVNTTIYNALPTDLKNVIIDTTVVSGYGSGYSSNFTSTDKLYLLSTREIWIDGDYNSSKGIDFYDKGYSSTRQLDYYENNNVYTYSYAAATKYCNGSAIYWWLRSAYSGNATAFFSVGNDGCWIRPDAYNEYGVSPAFRLG